MRKLIFIISLILFSTGVLFFFVYVNFYDGKLHLVVCDVGQGDAILLRTPNGQDVLIDGGPDKSVLSCLGRHMPFWDKTIEVIILTHPDADHVTGVVDVIKRYNVNALFTESNSGKTDIYKLFQRELADKKLSANFVEAGDKIKIEDNVELNVLSPQSNQPDPKANSGSLNVYSVVVKLSYNNFSALFTGDAPATVGDKIVGSVGKVDVLKVPHHGSKTGMNDAFLGTTTPQIALISVGANNRYGHPSKISLDLLSKYNVEIFRTDKNGEIEILSDGLTYSVSLQKK
jgi:competence protein ComEC